MRYIVLDVGSTYIKCRLIDTETGKSREEERRAFPAAVGNVSGRYEIDAPALCDECLSLIDAALENAPDASGILIGTQMHGFVLTDAQNESLTGYVSWRDGASLECAPEGGTYLAALDTLVRSLDFSRTGAPLRSKLAISNLYARLRQGLSLPQGARFHTLGSYLIARMCGAYVCHHQSAASTGFCDVVNARWLPELFEAIGAGSLVRPRIERSVHPIGTYRCRERGYAVFPDLGDHQVCALESGAKPEEDVNINIGTGGMVGLITRNFLPEYENRPLLDGFFIRTKTGLPAGRHLQEIVDSLLASAQQAGAELPEERVWAAMTRERPDSADCEILSACLHRDFMEYRAELYAGYGRAYAEAVASLAGEGVRRIVYSGGAALRNPALRRSIEEECKLHGYRRASALYGGTRTPRRFPVLSNA